MPRTFDADWGALWLCINLRPPDANERCASLACGAPHLKPVSECVADESRDDCCMCMVWALRAASTLPSCCCCIASSNSGTVSIVEKK